MAMTLERWDDRRRRWIMYDSQQSHSADCAKHPIGGIPQRVFLDTNVVNLIVKCSSPRSRWMVPTTSGGTPLSAIEKSIRFDDASDLTTGPLRPLSGRGLFRASIKRAYSRPPGTHA